MVQVIIILLLAAILVLTTMVWRLYRRLRIKQGTEHFIEDLLKHFFSSGREVRTIEEIMSWSALPEDRVRHHILVAQHRGWVELSGSHANIVAVTPAGLTYGAQMSRAHRIYECYLAQMTGYPMAEWHRRAERKEHYLSPQEVEEMSRRLGHPLFDPNGEPIPPRTGEIPDIRYIGLDEVESGVYTIASLPDNDEERYSALLSLGLAVGTPVQVSRAGKAVRLLLEGRSVAIQEEWQRHILLKGDSIAAPEVEGLIPLSMLQDNQVAEIVGLRSNIIGEKRRRLSDLGFVRGGEVRVYLRSPFGHPVAYLVRDTAIALRRDQSDHILVRPIEK